MENKRGILYVKRLRFLHILDYILGLGLYI